MSHKSMIRSGYDSARKNAFAIIASSIVGVITGTVAPMIQQHWSDQAIAREIKDAAETATAATAASESRLQAEITQQHTDSIADRQALWQAISAIQTHTYAMPVTTAGQLPNASESLKRAAAVINAKH